MLWTASHELVWFCPFPVNLSLPIPQSLTHSLTHSFIHKRKGIPKKATVDFSDKGKDAGEGGRVAEEADHTADWFVKVKELRKRKRKKNLCTRMETYKVQRTQPLCQSPRCLILNLLFPPRRLWARACTSWQV